MALQSSVNSLSRLALAAVGTWRRAGVRVKAGFPLTTEARNEAGKQASIPDAEQPSSVNGTWENTPALNSRVQL
ncbi:hypothetical protein E2C01_006914 [Portunus trituberculatus]|uniref:Uncharacterized protein n=1 Tax=Portunus trituberculatus TaxID=210409 RepID=A0A5B7CWE4_PORTR|nr:hypothetical protein [Portunus trituberculatus]